MSTPSPMIEDRDCRNRKSKYMSARDAPACINHPTGTLPYMWHTAYDRLLAGTGNRSNTYVVLVGYEQRNKYDSLKKFIMSYFEDNRRTWLGLNLDSDAAKTPKARLKEALTQHVTKLRDDRLWQEKDDEVYIDLALMFFIRDSHFHWMRRPEQKHGEVEVAARPDSQQGNEGDARKRRRITPILVDSSHSVFGTTGRHDTVARLPSSTDVVGEGATLATAIDVDMEDTGNADTTLNNTAVNQRGIEEHRPRNIGGSDSPALVSALNRTIVQQDSINQHAHSEKRFQEENASLRRRLIASQNETAQQQSDNDRLRNENDLLMRDNAALGLALAENSGIRRNSAAAVRNDTSKRTILPKDVAERLMENPGFTDVWFDGW